MTDWSYQVGGIVQVGRQARANDCLHYGLYPFSGLFVRALGASANGPVTHWGVTPPARTPSAPLLPGITRVAAEFDPQLDTEVFDAHRTSQVITRGGEVRAAWAVISHLHGGSWTVPIKQAWEDFLTANGLVEIHFDPDWEVNPISQAQQAEPSGPDSAILQSELITSIDAYLTEIGLDTAGRENILAMLGLGPAAASALLM